MNGNQDVAYIKVTCTESAPMSQAPGALHKEAEATKSGTAGHHPATAGHLVEGAGHPHRHRRNMMLHKEMSTLIETKEIDTVPRKRVKKPNILKIGLMDKDSVRKTDTSQSKSDKGSHRRRHHPHIRHLHRLQACKAKGRRHTKQTGKVCQAKHFKRST